VVELRWAGERWVVLAERALWWERRRTLCIADLHLGKGAAFRRAGVPVPEGSTDHDLARLAQLVKEWGARRLVILGDLLHAREGRGAQTMESFAGWRQSHQKLDVLLIRGNHDVRAGDPPLEWKFRTEDEPFADAGDDDIRFAHVPRETGDGHTLCGHIHPAVAMVGAASRARAPCFWFCERLGVLPAFGSFTGMRAVRPAPGDRVLAIGEGEVVEVGGVGARASARRGRKSRNARSRGG